MDNIAKSYIIVKPVGKKMSAHIYELVKTASLTCKSGMGYALKRGKNDVVHVNKGVFDNVDIFIAILKNMKIDKKDFLCINLRYTIPEDKNLINIQPVISSTTEKQAYLKNPSILSADEVALFSSGTAHLYRDNSTAVSKKSDLVNLGILYFSDRNVLKGLSILYKSISDRDKFLDSGGFQFFSLLQFVIVGYKYQPIVIGKEWYEDNHGILHNTKYYINIHKTSKGKIVETHCL